MSMMTLYGYWRSTAAYRVRIALNLKGLEYQHASVDLVKEGGQQKQSPYRELNPQQLVPALALDSGDVLTQSLAIIEYLDAEFPEPSLYPDHPVARAQATAAAHAIAMDIHPVNNLRVVQHLAEQHDVDADGKVAWMQHWMRTGFDALEQQLSGSGLCAMGDTPGIVDICLCAQLYNAHRWGVALDAYPRLQAIESHCQTLDAFVRARPENQPDAS